MDRLMPFDELNIFRTMVENIYETDEKNRKRYLDFLLDDIEEILILSYLFGNEAANTMLDLDIRPEEGVVEKSVYRKIAGKDWKQRVTEYIEKETDSGKAIPLPAAVEEIMRVVETDSHRIYNEAMWNVAETAQKRGIVIYKRWETMLDDRVRDTHLYLQGESVPLNEYYYTYNGNYALRPGGFGVPEEDIGCRCRLVLTRAYP